MRGGVGLLGAASCVTDSAGGRSAPVRATSINHHGNHTTIWNTLAATESASDSSGTGRGPSA